MKFAGILLHVLLTAILFVTPAFSYEIPESQLTKPVYIEVDGKIAYETKEPLSTATYILTQANNSGDIKLTINGNSGLFTISIKYNNGSNIKLSIDKNNILRKAVIYDSKTKRQEVFEGKNLINATPKMIFTTGLLFNDSIHLAKEKAIKNEQKRVAQIESEKRNFVSDNLLNFDRQMPLFAGLRWDDRLYDVLSKLAKVPSYNLGELECENIYTDEKTAEFQLLLTKLNKIGKAKSEAKNILIEQIIDLSRIISDANNFEYCSLRALVTMANMPGSIDVKIGRGKDENLHTVGVENYLHNIIISVSDNGDETDILDLYKNKYKNFKYDKASSPVGTRGYVNAHVFSDDFENTVNIYHWYTLEIAYIKNSASEAKQASIQKTVIDKINELEKEKQKRNRIKSTEPSGDSAI